MSNITYAQPGAVFGGGYSNGLSGNYVSSGGSGQSYTTGGYTTGYSTGMADVSYTNIPMQTQMIPVQQVQQQMETIMIQQPVMEIVPVQQVQQVVEMVPVQPPPLLVYQPQAPPSPPLKEKEKEPERERAAPRARALRGSGENGQDRGARQDGKEPSPSHGRLFYAKSGLQEPVDLPELPVPVQGFAGSELIRSAAAGTGK